MIKNITVKKLLFFLFLASVFALISAYISQYFFGLKPCILCLHQRKPFFVIILLYLISLFLKSEKADKILLNLCAIALIVNCAIAFYHSGVERKIFTTPSTCSFKSADEVTNLQELADILLNTNAVKCDEVQFTFLSLSMASWNFIYCLFLVIILLIYNRVIRRNIIR